jgi:HEPN domain-containing protein
MQPLDPDTVLVLREWIEKADADLHVAEQMAAEAAVNLRVREIVGFHCQQAAEKYLKALLTRHQIEFPKTHDLQVLLEFVDRVDPGRADAMREADWLSPFGVKVRYPGDTPEMLPGDEQKALDLARRVKRVVRSTLGVSLGP